jgi:hypothetical protein
MVPEIEMGLLMSEEGASFVPVEQLQQASRGDNAAVPAWHGVSHGFVDRQDGETPTGHFGTDPAPLPPMLGCPGRDGTEQEGRHHGHRAWHVVTQRRDRRAQANRREPVHLCEAAEGQGEKDPDDETEGKEPADS